ncbi:MAG: heat shock protein HslJ [Yokenella regensburgei]|jgi:heat shock protein HslJ|uniref:Heat shock protein HslJ n=3 Tax=Yokenella regensburgei TaxID=158877 RepID=A0AB38FSC2_9ENTR|nr:heat shock protein HslJ [Yokenella regensburgei]EHM47592.1 META domain protein [Yokenella regensburgei ATCC 43003]KAF1366663.1 heat shock protein HslJ [Yokenella regensburgei]MDQ4432032.1 heat shock protein HslJ [Yokenella regensburgei]MDR3103754.1 heat shock protein HslJ [Yokenella regensburgei]QIU88766.1 heat shock protein HslJ [Yokenella regensburgei]
MNKTILLLAAGMLLAGCVNTSKVTVNESQLQHHRFVLESVNGKNIAPTQTPPELSFGEKMHVSGKMCNGFTGEGKLSEGALTVKNMAMTQMLCPDAELSKLDHTLSAMLARGAQVDLTGDQLTLATADQTLVYKLADLMH